MPPMLFRDENGLVFEADEVFGITQGYEPVTPQEEHQMRKAEALKARGEERGALGTAVAGATGLASGLTLGASDWLLGGGLSDIERQDLLAEIEAHPIARGAGEIGGALIGGFATPGSAAAHTPAGFLGSLASQQVEAGVARGGFRGAAQAIGAMGAEGALQNAGQYIGWAALQDKEATAEGLSGALGTGFAFGAAGGGVALGVSNGTIVARRLYSRFADGSGDAVKTAESAWSTAREEALQADLANAQTARERLDAINAAKVEALRYAKETKARVTEERIRAASATARVPEEGINVSDTGIEGPVPLDEGISGARGGMPTSIFQRPVSGEFNPGDAFRFDQSLPTLDEGPVPLIDDIRRPSSGPQTSIFQRPTEGAATLPRTAEDVVDESVTTVPARAIEQHGFESLSVPGKDKVKTDKARAAIKEGQRDPIVITVSPAGKYQVEDGTHRLAAAIESGADIKVKWFKGSAGLDEAAPSNLVVKGDLEQQLASMKAQLDEGKSIKEVGEQAVPGSPVSPQIPPSKTPPRRPGRNPSDEIEKMLAEKRAADTTPSLQERLKRGVIPKVDQDLQLKALREDAARARAENEALERHIRENWQGPKRPRMQGLRDAVSRKFNEFVEEAPTALSDLRFRKTEELLGKEIAIEEEKLIAALDTRRQTEELASKFLVPPEEFGVSTGSGFVRPAPPAPVGPKTNASSPRAKQLAALDAAHDDALKMAAEATDPFTRGEAVKAAADLEQIIARLAPEDDFVREINEAHSVFRAREKAIRDLAEALGDGAHPASVEFAKKVAAAEDEAVKKATDRAARAIDDAEQFGPVELSPKERVRFAREQHLAATKELDRLMVDAEQAKLDLQLASRKAKEGQRAKKQVLREEGKLARDAARAAASREKFTILGGVAEMANIPGLPKPSDIPVIGPLLGAWLKYRTLKAAFNKTFGRIPATADARAAALAARTRDRVARAVDKSLTALAKGSAVVGRAAPQVAGVLAHRIYDDGQPDARKGAPMTEVAAVRMREIQAYVTAPGAIENDVRRELRDITDPDFIAAVEKHRRMAFEHLASTLPKMPEHGLLEKVKWQPAPLQALSFARRLEAINDPAGVLERLTVTQHMISLEAAETLRVVYPQMFAMAQQRLMQKAAELQTSIPYAKRVHLSLVYQLPLDSGLEPDSLRLTQSVFEKKATPAPVSPDQPAAPPTPSVAQPTDLAASYVMPGDRRAMQR